MTDEQLLEWQAVALIDGWANGWQQTAEIVSAIQWSANRQILQRVPSENSAAAEKEMDWSSGHEIMIKMTDYSKKKHKKNSRLQTPAQAQQILQRRYG